MLSALYLFLLSLHLRHIYMISIDTQASISSMAASQYTDADHIADYLLSCLNIHVTGACGPKRLQPIETFRPIHQSYHRPINPDQPPISAAMDSSLPGGSLRTVNTSMADSGVAVVYDRDVVSTWRMPSESPSPKLRGFVSGLSAALSSSTRGTILERLTNGGRF